MSHVQAEVVSVGTDDTEAATRAQRDGRCRRGQTTHAKIIAACRSLMRRGILRPTAAEIASISGVATRTVFVHFKDVRSLYARAIEEPGLMAILLDHMPDNRDDLFRVMLLRDHIPLFAEISRNADRKPAAA